MKKKLKNNLKEIVVHLLIFIALIVILLLGGVFIFRTERIFKVVLNFYNKHSWEMIAWVLLSGTVIGIYLAALIKKFIRKFRKDKTE